MAKSLVPTYVAAALQADRTQQLQTIAALTVYLFGEQKANREVSELGALLFKQAPHRSLKTWQNYASTVGAIVSGRTPKLEALWAEHVTPEAIILPLTQWLDHELKARKYHSSPEDVANWAKGRPSLKAQAQAKEKAEKEAAALQAKLDAQAATQTQAQADALLAQAQTQQQEEQQQEQATADRDAEKRALSKAANVIAQAAMGYPDAIQAPSADSAPVFLMSAARALDGSLSLTMADGLTRADVVALALALENMLDSPEFQATPAPQVQETAEA